MKLKKTFLLICIIICFFTISSVCASEYNNTTVTGLQETQTIDSEDLNPQDKDLLNSNLEDNSNTLKDEGVKKNITIDVEDSAVKHYVGSPIDFTARLNESVTGYVIFNINGENYTASILNSNTATYRYTPLNNDTLNVVATFLGNSEYNFKSSALKEVDVSKIQTEILLTAETPLVYGNLAVINIELNASINDTVELVIGGKTYYVAIIGGKGKFSTQELDAGIWDADVTFAGDNMYSKCIYDTSFKIEKADLKAFASALNCSVLENTTFITNFNNDFKGNISIEVDGKILYNGNAKTIITSSNLTAGDKTASITFYGDANYNELTKDVKFTVSRVTPSMNVLIDDVTYPGNAMAAVVVANNANGTVNITVDGKVFQSKVINGSANVDLCDLSAGSKVADVGFFTDDDYNGNATASFKFNINKANPSIDIEVQGMYVYNEAIVINITPIGSDGNINVTINGINYPVLNKQIKIENIAANEYTILAKLEESENYTSAINTTTFKVIPAKSQIQIDVDPAYMYGDEIIIELNTNLEDDDLIVTVNGVEQKVFQKVTIVDALMAGDYIINAFFKGNENYTACSTNKSFEVIKDNINVLMLNASSPIFVGSPVTLTAMFDENVGGEVVFSINGANYSVFISNENIAKFTYTPLKEGNFDVVVMFMENDKYRNASLQKSFIANPISSSLYISIDKTSICAGDNAVVSVFLNPSISGVATVKVGGVDHIVGIVNGEGSLTLYDLNDGSYNIYAEFGGSEGYGPSSSNNLTLIVGEKTPIQMSVNINVSKCIATVELPDAATGNLSVYIDGSLYNITDIYKTPIIIGIGKLNSGNHTIEIVYSGDDHFSSASYFSKLQIQKYSDYKFTLYTKVDRASVDIIVSSCDDIVAPILIDVDGVGYYANATGGQAKLHLDDLSPGVHDVVAIYCGDEYYALIQNATSFTIKNITLNAKAIALNITVSDNSLFVIDVDKKFKGNVSIKVDGKIIYDGPVKLLIQASKLTEGDKTATFEFYGDSSYDKLIIDDVKFKVSAGNTNIDVVIADAVYPNPAIAIVNAGDNSNGTVFIKVDGKTFNAKLSNGIARIYLTGLSPGSKIANVRFEGDSDNATAVAKFKVKQAASKITSKSKTFKSKNTKKYTIYLKADKAIRNAKVTLKIKSKTYKATTDANGKATFKITKLTKKGKYTAVITYGGNAYYAKATKKVKITVKGGKTKKPTFKSISHATKDKIVVKKVQIALKNKGYYTIYKKHYLKIDGKYNKYTIKAIKQYQKDNGLKVTGIVDYKTAKKLGVI